MELFADPEFIAAILGELVVPQVLLEGEGDKEALAASMKQKITFWHTLGYDALWLTPDVADPRMRLPTEDSAPIRKAQRQWVNEGVGPVRNMADFEHVPWPKPEDANLFPLEYAARHLPEGMGILAGVRGPLEFVMELVGFETFFLALYDQPELIDTMFSTRYGDEIAVIGGVDVDLLARGTEEQVRDRTRRILTACMPSRGYILGSGNSIANYVAPQNFLAMLDEGRRYGA